MPANYGIARGSSYLKEPCDQQAVHDARGVSFTPHPARKHPDNLIMTADKQNAKVRYSLPWHDPQDALSFVRDDLAQTVGSS